MNVGFVILLMWMFHQKPGAFRETISWPDFKNNLI